MKYFRACVLQALYYGGGGLRGGGGSHEIFTNKEGGPTIFLLLPGGDQKFNRVFHPVSTTPPVS